ncbi:hypothetical protein JYU29_05655 [Tianweitania sp. BSSL-BM11]|uniref:Uncharacterized protein n=1 Tax=Tianweitania aestuarii TaxID=2814886 RepID=A0ABS5RSY4_9HYPH|nr:hypothetical protein [Tianweitania aestuarii]MBS9720171.1 hypothetical protein [Tianweitania aestuarii]
MIWLADLVSRFVTDPDDLAAAEILLVDVNQGRSSPASSFLQLCRLVGESAADNAELLTALEAVPDVSTLTLLGLLVIACFAAVRAEYSSRPDAQAAREKLAAQADNVLDAAGTLFGPVVHSWLIRLVGEAVVQISAIAATRAPLVRVETNLSLPSSLIAYDLYGDPQRGADLVERNRSRTPLIMPVVLEAVSS